VNGVTETTSAGSNVRRVRRITMFQGRDPPEPIGPLQLSAERAAPE
jgi:hypothetical protein